MPDWLRKFAREHRTGFLMLTGIGVFLTLISPLGSGSLPFHWRLIYWVGLMYLGGSSGHYSALLLERAAPTLPLFPRYALIAAMVSLPVSAAVIAIQAASGSLPPLQYWPFVYMSVLVVSSGVSLMTYLFEHRAGASGDSQAGRALTDKLPPRLRSADILALESEDHYLRVHTSRGDELILMRLSDAMAAVETLEGSQTHRSWWVAREAIADVERENGRAKLTLTSGAIAPVSRTYVPVLREKGWI
ncbi:LytTR family DNA-binding domain-containing protein [Maricaulis sp.]|uniref:LytTR family DNA-binding domain-containing protein n=1 Tax=Maricaulis sp. TaxID=1486257 RepID=UPI00262E3554|nr:LytTR family DNA-binding domain-containing protein [Maricaulis sp.]